MKEQFMYDHDMTSTEFANNGDRTKKQYLGSDEQPLEGLEEGIDQDEAIREKIRQS